MAKQKLGWEIYLWSMNGKYDGDYISVRGKKSGIKKLKALAKDNPNRCYTLKCYAINGDLLESNADETEEHGHWDSESKTFDWSVF